MNIQVKCWLIIVSFWIVIGLLIGMTLSSYPQVLNEMPLNGQSEPIEVNQFTSPEELKVWLYSNGVSEVPQIIKAGDLTITWDCDDYALKLQEDALEDGYLLNVQIFKAGTKLPMSNKVVRKAHAMNTAFIGNEVWLIEPSTDECWLAWYVEE